MGKRSGVQLSSYGLKINLKQNLFLTSRTMPLPVKGKLVRMRPLPFKDYDYIGNRYVNIQDETNNYGEIMWYERKDINPFDTTTPTECVICIEAENEMLTKYAHPKAHLEAHTEAGIIAEQMAIKEKETEESIDYYIFYYGREYKKVYRELLKKYKEEYYAILLEKTYEKNEKLCYHHLESIQYHSELKSNVEENISPIYDFKYC